MSIKKDILKELRNISHNNRIKLPRDIDFEFEGNTLTMLLKKEAIGVYYSDSKGKPNATNMQEDLAAFEGWAIVIKANWNTECNYKVVIDIPDHEIAELPDPKDVFIRRIVPEIASGHYGRFLFRARKFSEEFEWFGLSDKISKCAEKYDLLLEEYECTNHLPDKEAGDNNRGAEIRAEASFNENPVEIEKLSDKQVLGTVYRQLGTWLESKDGSIQFLTDGHSAIDLWNITNNTLNLFELKSVTRTNKNDKVGIITELFMYMEYCHDMFLKNSRFVPKGWEKDNASGRGYGELVKADIERIRGYFLANKFHPLLTEKAVDLLNTNQSGMEYVKLPEYDLDHILKIRKHS